MRNSCLTFAFLVAFLAPAYAEDQFEAQIASAQQAMMSDPAAALALAEAAQDMAGADPVRQATAQWLEGEALNRLNRPLEAAPILDQALDMVAAAAPGSKLQGDLLMARARAAKSEGDYQVALENFQHAHDAFAGLGEARSQAMAIMEIGSIYTDAGSFARALQYYERAGAVYAGDAPVDLSRLNNVANAFRQLGRLEEAENGFREALTIAEQMGSPMLRARILTNIAEVQVRRGRISEAEQTIEAALRLNAEGWAPFLWGVRAHAASAQGDLTRAARFIGQAFADADLASTTMPYREVHRLAYEVFNATGETSLSLRHLEAFKRLDDEARDVMASANMALMGAQFDFANQELEIAQLRAATLEAEARQRTLLFVSALIVALIVLAALGYGYGSMRRSRNRVQKINAQLNETNVALEKALKAKSEFLATTSHEIRTPLNGILGMTQVMLQDAAINPDLRERVAIVHGAGETMRAIVDDILDAAKIESGGLTVAAEPFNPGPAIEDVARLWRINAEAKGLSFELDLSACPPRLVGDEQRLRQIVFNLLSNAVKFTEAGQVSLRARREEGSLLIDVADTGMGIPDDELEAIFAAFHQVNSTTTRTYSGTGLGLSISRNLSRALGGDIAVASTLGAGSTFTLRLPVPADNVANPGAGPAGADVLAVEPNFFNRCLLEAFCAESGRTFLAVEDLEAATQALQTQSVELAYVTANALSSAPDGAMSSLLALREAAGTARLVVWIEDASVLQEPLARLCGADAVLTGPFDAAAALANTPPPRAA
jgi:signal transduction histidine kinase